MTKNFAERLKEANFASKKDIADFANKTYFDEKLRSINKNVTSNKTKHVEAEKKLNDVLEKVKLIPIKELAKDLINGCSILNGAKCFSREDGS